MSSRVAALGFVLAVAAASCGPAGDDDVSTAVMASEGVDGVEVESPVPLPEADWVETFDQLDPARWRVEFSTYGDSASQHCYRPENVTVVDGALHIEARPGPVGCPGGEERPYSSGMLRTRDLLDFTHGRFEIDAKMPVGAGLWPALWLSPTERRFGPWPRSGEIDIAEVLGHDPDRVICSVHYWSEAEDGHDKSVGSIVSPPGVDSLRTYGLEWSEQELVWSVDGRECHRADLADLGQRQVFDQRFHLKINLALGGEWPGPLDPGAVPATMVVEEIRYWPAEVAQ
jgi:beta-glucanase (GH16 family)